MIAVESNTIRSSTDDQSISYLRANRLAITPEVITAERKSAPSTMVEVENMSSGAEEVNSPTIMIPRAIKSVAARIF